MGWRKNSNSKLGVSRHFTSTQLTTVLGVVFLMSACQTLPTSTLKRDVDTQETLNRVLEHSDTKQAISETSNPSSQPTNRYSPNPYSSVNQDVSTGSGQFVQPRYQAPMAQTSELSGQVSLAFDGAPIAQVIDTVVGQMLGADFVIDPAVKGTVTLRTAKPVAKTDLPELLTKALSLSNVSLVKDGANSYMVVPSSTQRRFASAPQLAGDRSGAGVVIAPLDYVSATEMLRAIEPFVPQGAQIKADEVRETLILSGTPSQIDVLVDTIEMFDVDWLSQMSFGVYEAKYASPADLVEELDKVFGGQDGPIGTQVEFVAMPRLSSVMVIAKRPGRLRQAETWIRKLDIDVGGVGRSFQFLPVLNADAESVAETLSDLFGNQNSGSSYGGYGDDLQGGSSGQGERRVGGNGSANDSLRIKAEIATNSLIVYANDD